MDKRGDSIVTMIKRSTERTMDEHEKRARDIAKAAEGVKETTLTTVEQIDFLNGLIDQDLETLWSLDNVLVKDWLRGQVKELEATLGSI
jgi:hypothetical protein